MVSAAHCRHLHKSSRAGEFIAFADKVCIAGGAPAKQGMACGDRK